MPDAAMCYTSVTYVLNRLSNNKEVTISIQNDWIIAIEKSGLTMWSFAPEYHSAYPAVAKRTLLQHEDGGWSIYMEMLCEADKNSCDRLLAEFKELNNRMKNDIERDK